MRHTIPLILYNLDPMNDNNRDEAEVLVEEHIIEGVYRHAFGNDDHVTMNADDAKRIMKFIRDECDEHLISSETHSLRRNHFYVNNKWEENGNTCYGSYIVKKKKGGVVKGVALVIGEKLYISNLLDTDEEDCIVGVKSISRSTGPGERGDESLNTNKSRREIPPILKAAFITIYLFISKDEELHIDGYWTVYHYLWDTFNEKEKDALCRLHHNKPTTLKVNFTSVKEYLNAVL